MKEALKRIKEKLQLFKRNDVIGFGLPNDLSGHLLRSRVAGKYGLFGMTPMWGGVKVHEFYPPLSSIFINIFSLKVNLLLSIIYGFSIFAFYKDPMVGLAFIVSYFFLSPLLYCGRFPEILGHLFVIHAFFAKEFYLSGLLLGLAGLTHPLSLLFGLILLLAKFNIFISPETNLFISLETNLFIYLIAGLVCGWWVLPFFLRRKKVGYLAQKEKYGTVLSIYLISWATIFNNLIFIFAPLWAAGFLGLVPWFSSWFDKEIRLKKLKKRPLFLKAVLKLYPAVGKIKSQKVVILPKPERKIPPSAIWDGRWAISTFLLDRGIITYNGLAETEVPMEKIKIPKNIKTYYI